LTDKKDYDYTDYLTQMNQTLLDLSSNIGSFVNNIPKGIIDEIKPLLDNRYDDLVSNINQNTPMPNEYNDIRNTIPAAVTATDFKTDNTSQGSKDNRRLQTLADFALPEQEENKAILETRDLLREIAETNDRMAHFIESQYRLTEEFQRDMSDLVDIVDEQT
jgi:hypothetical protein